MKQVKVKAEVKKTNRIKKNVRSTNKPYIPISANFFLNLSLSLNLILNLFF